MDKPERHAYPKAIRARYWRARKGNRAAILNLYGINSPLLAAEGWPHGSTFDFGVETPSFIEFCAACGYSLLL